MARRRRNQSVSFPSASDAASLDSAFPSADSPAVAAATLKDAKDKAEIQKAVAEIPEIFSAEQVKFTFDVYCALLSFIYSVALKSDYKAISAELSFEDAEKDLMAKPLARILSKYAPKEWAGMGPEIELITMLGVWTMTSVTRAKKAAEKYAAEQAKELREKQHRNQTHPVRNNRPVAPAMASDESVTV
jgi:hypothetical protein